MVFECRHYILPFRNFGEKFCEVVAVARWGGAMMIGGVRGSEVRGYQIAKCQICPSACRWMDANLKVPPNHLILKRRRSRGY